MNATKPQTGWQDKRKELAAERERDEASRRKAVLERLKRGPKTPHVLSGMLGWAGGVVGVGAVLRQLAERDEAHESENGVWLAGPGPERRQAEVQASTLDVRRRLLEQAETRWMGRVELASRVVGAPLADVMFVIVALVREGELEVEARGPRVRLRPQGQAVEVAKSVDAGHSPELIGAPNELDSAGSNPALHTLSKSENGSSEASADTRGEPPTSVEPERSVEGDSGATAERGLVAPLGPLANDVLRELRRHPEGIAVRELAAILTRNAGSVRGSFQELRQRGLATSTGWAKEARWFPTSAVSPTVELQTAPVLPLDLQLETTQEEVDAVEQGRGSVAVPNVAPVEVDAHREPEPVAPSEDGEALGWDGSGRVAPPPYAPGCPAGDLGHQVADPGPPAAPDVPATVEGGPGREHWPCPACPHGVIEDPSYEWMCRACQLSTPPHSLPSTPALDAVSVPTDSLPPFLPPMSIEPLPTARPAPRGHPAHGAGPAPGSIGQVQREVSALSDLISQITDTCDGRTRTTERLRFGLAQLADQAGRAATTISESLDSIRSRLDRVEARLLEVSQRRHEAEDDLRDWKDANSALELEQQAWCRLLDRMGIDAAPDGEDLGWRRGQLEARWELLVTGPPGGAA